MTPQEISMIQRAYANAAALQARELGWITRLYTISQRTHSVQLSDKETAWLHRIDERLTREGAVSHDPIPFWTISGRRIHLREITAADVDIHDIAHGLSHLCRFGGQCRQWYSVAQHSIRVALEVPEEQRLLGLLHDASEAYLGDMPTPLKRLLPDYSRLESTVWKAIAERFGLPEEMSHQVKAADLEVLRAEARENTKLDLGPSTVAPVRILSAEEAREQFLAMAEQLMEVSYA